MTQRAEAIGTEPVSCASAVDAAASGDIRELLHRSFVDSGNSVLRKKPLPSSCYRPHPEEACVTTPSGTPT